MDHDANDDPLSVPGTRLPDGDPTSEAYARALDERDPLADFREAFSVPDGHYMDGNSLGPVSDAAEAALDRVVAEWRELGIEGWTDGDPPWFDYAERLGASLAPLVGAGADEVVVANSTTVNIHTLVGTFYDPERGGGTGQGGKVVVDDLDFPTDHYAVRAQLRSHGQDPDEALRVVESRDGRTIETEDVLAAVDDDVSLVFLPSVLYRSGQLFDIERITEAAHAHDALAGFDLAHSVGVVPHDLSGHGVDFAVWCHYKYLNAGPGAPAGLYVAERHHGEFPALPGWWGNEKATQFDMELTYTPAESAGAWQIGTPPVLAMAPLEGALSVVHDAGIDAIREKSLALTDYLVTLVDRDLPDCTVGTPRARDARGGHVAVEHPDAYRVGEALRDRDVVVDVRPPNVVRICPAPLYTGFRDVYAVVDELRDVVESGAYEAYDRPDGVT